MAAMINGDDPSFAATSTTWLNFRSLGWGCLEVWADERLPGGRAPVAPAGTNPPAQTLMGGERGWGEGGGEVNGRCL